MNRIVEVCLLALTLATSITPYAAAQTPAMTRGISVQMPITTSAASEPDADKEDAKIITITESGDIDFGIDLIAITDLPEKIRSTPFIRGQKLYIKADARTPYSKVLQVLEATRTGGIAPQVLLAAQAESPAPGSMVLPKGLEVLLDQPAGSQPTRVQVIRSEQGAPMLKVNGRQIPSANLQNMLTQIFQNRPEKVVQAKADGQLSFGDVVHVIDACHAAGAKVVLATPEL